MLARCRRHQLLRETAKPGHRRKGGHSAVTFVLVRRPRSAGSGARCKGNDAGKETGGGAPPCVKARRSGGLQHPRSGWSVERLAGGKHAIDKDDPAIFAHISCCGLTMIQRQSCSGGKSSKVFAAAVEGHGVHPSSTWTDSPYPDAPPSRCRFPSGCMGAVCRFRSPSPSLCDALGSLFYNVLHLVRGFLPLPTPPFTPSPRSH